MNRQARVLVVDDLEQWREELVETLQRDGLKWILLLQRAKPRAVESDSLPFA